MSDTENIQNLINERNNQNKRIEQLVLEIERLKEWKEDLLSENVELENIRKEAVEYIKEDMYGEPNELYGLVDGEHLLNILNRGE